MSYPLNDGPIALIIPLKMCYHLVIAHSHLDNGLFLLQSQETIARVFTDHAVFRQVTRGALATVSVLGEEVDSLRFAATQSHFGFAKIVLYSFAVGVFVSHLSSSLVNIFLS